MCLQNLQNGNALLLRLLDVMDTLDLYLYNYIRLNFNNNNCEDSSTHVTNYACTLFVHCIMSNWSLENPPQSILYIPV